jgi:nitrogen fixation NifU-like protein
MYSELLLDHFRNPRNAGELDAPAVRVEVANPACGDVLRLSARVEDGRIVEARFKARGCTASIAAGSALAECVVGRSVDELTRLTPLDIEQALDGLPEASKHAAALAVDAARALVARLTK